MSFPPLLRYLQKQAISSHVSVPTLASSLRLPPANLRTQVNGRLLMLSYDHRESDLFEPLVQVSRSLILERRSTDEGKENHLRRDRDVSEKGSNVSASFHVISRGFDKFVPVTDKKDWHRYEVKEDGSILMVTKKPQESGGGLRVATSGNMDAGNARVDVDRDEAPTRIGAKTYRDLFREAGGEELQLIEGFTFIFELLHPDIPSALLPCSAPRLVHLATRCLKTGAFVYDQAHPHSPFRPKSFSPTPGEYEGSRILSPSSVKLFSLSEADGFVKLLPWDQEGLVAVRKRGDVPRKTVEEEFDNHPQREEILERAKFVEEERAKLKTPAFVALQKLKALYSSSPPASPPADVLSDALTVALTLHKARSHLPASLPLQAKKVIEEARKGVEELVRRVGGRRCRGGVLRKVQGKVGGKKDSKDFVLDVLRAEVSRPKELLEELRSG